MKKFLFLALFCALAANCGESARADKISAAGKLKTHEPLKFSGLRECSAR